MRTTGTTSFDPAAVVIAQELQLGFPGGPLLSCPAHAWPAGLHLVQGGEGVGKTALLCTLAGDIEPRGGTLKYGCDAAADVFWRHPRSVPDERSLQATSRDWVRQRSRSFPKWSAKDFERHAEGLDLQVHLHKPLLALSTGSLRKLWMAAAWASGAALTLIDEPLAALDKASIQYVQDTLNEFRLANQQARDGETSRCMIVAHWDEMQRVDWDGVLTLA